MKNVDDYLQIIEHHPLAGGKSVNCHRSQRILLAQVCLNFVGNRFELRFGRARADHEKVRKARNAA